MRRSYRDGVFIRIMESNLSITAPATPTTLLDPLVRAESGAPPAAAMSSGFMVDLWVRLGIVGVLVMGASLAALLLGEAGIVDAVVGVLAGGVLSVGAWRFTRSAFREASDASS